MSRLENSSLRRRLEVTMVGVALVSVLLLAGVNYFFARALVDDSMRAQLGALRDTRVQAVERAAGRIESEVSTLGVTPSVVAALTEFATEYDRLNVHVSDEDISGLEEVYDEALERVQSLDGAIDSESLLPESVAGRYLQERYIVENPAQFDDRDELLDAGDGSGYSRVHAEFHPLLRDLMTNAQMSDLLLVDAVTRDVVYSTKKRVDFGTDLVDGPFSESQIGQVLDRLADVPIGEAVISDSDFYIPAHGEPVVFVASAVRSGPEVVGAVITEMPVAAVTAIVTADQGWDLLGLGDSGDIYIVGGDGTLRTDPRLFSDDSEQFLAELQDERGDEELTALVDTLGSPALLVPVENTAVTEAQAGEDFVGTVTNPLGERTLAASGPVVIGDLDWVVVVEQNSDESREATGSLWRITLIVMAILLPITAVLGMVFARSLTRPFEALVAAAARIARGEPATDVEDLGANELGDVGRQLDAVATQLEAREEAILAEEQNISDVLNAVLPPRLVDRVRRGERGIDDIVDTATVVSVSVENLPDALGSDQDMVVEITDHISDELDGLMERFDLDRVRRSSTGALFVAGLDHPDARVEDAARFAAAILSMVAAVGDEYGHDLVARAGLAAGEVATGVIGTSQVSFGVWGDPVGTAVSLDAVAEPGMILVDASVTSVLGPGWSIGPVETLAGLADDVIATPIAWQTADEPA